VDGALDSGGTAMNFGKEQLKVFVERIEKIEIEIGALQDAKADLYAEARWFGFDVKALRSVIGFRQARQHCDIDSDELYKAFRRSPHVSPDEAAGKICGTRGYIYFAHFTTTNRLKIGFTTRLNQRLTALANAGGEQCELIGLIPGDRSIEMRTLMAFGQWRLTGEWFLYTPECAAQCADYLKAFNEAQVLS
jgi:uncharacterized protein (UPF0335 family)